jgi:hypothetical protein
MCVAIFVPLPASKSALGNTCTETDSTRLRIEKFYFVHRKYWEKCTEMSDIFTENVCKGKQQVLGPQRKFVQILQKLFSFFYNLQNFA